MALTSFLPGPTQLPQDQLEAEEKARSQRSRQTSLVSSQREPPPYGYRKGWIPRLLEDFGNGSAFPESHVAQYPMDMGRKKKNVKCTGHSDDPDLQRPDEEAIKKITEKTRVAIEKSVLQKCIQYTASQQGVAFNSGAKQRVIRMVENKKDPMESPRFKINKRIPQGPPSPPAPEQQEWKIPPCISNWKNAKGNAAQVERKMAQKEKEKHEEKLREMAQKARERRIRAGIKTHVEKEDGETRERDEIRHDRQKERQHNRTLSRTAPDKRSKLQRNENRDISEVTALGVPNPRTSNEVQYDQRLFNQSKGMDSGFAGAEDEIYNVCDQAWRGGKDMAQNIYRPNKNLDKDMYGDDLEARIKTNTFVPDKEFSGLDSKQRGREGPVQFEEDPFGLDKFLKEAKQHHGSKRPSDSSRPKEHEHEGKKRRKEQMHLSSQ
ncbi:unnamed protein product [Nyctereutes procyonoides]|uniref:SNW domain-containing protein 1 n=1 Tax=Nyctereutes procyonoides TaxID=34880 RepID=A0A811ZXP3_NYCPR|nr:unnamed protein product [Nyctereutes procyonoides]